MPDKRTGLFCLSLSFFALRRMNLFRFILILTAIFCSLFPQKTLAVTRPDVFELSLEELLEIPIVAASTISEKPSDSPASAIVFSSETIRERGYTNLLDLLEDVPQIEVNRRVDTGHNNYLTVMGISGVERMQIMVDGIRVTPITGNLYSLGRQFSLQNAQRVEIIFGPMSSIYGADVFSGLINIVTHNGHTSKNSGVHLETGSFSTNNLSLTFNSEIKGLLKESSTSNPGFSLTFHDISSDGPNLPKFFPKEFAWYNNQFQSGRMLNFPGSNAESKTYFRPFSVEENSRFIQARFNHKRFELGMIRISESHSSSTGVLPDFTIYDRSAVFETHYNTIYGIHRLSGPSNRWNLQSQISHHFYEVDPATNLVNNFSGYQPGYKYARDRSTSIEERLTLRTSRNKILTLGLTYQQHDSMPRTADLSSPYNRDVPIESQGYIYPGSNLGALLPQGIPLETYKINYENFGGYAQLQTNSNRKCQIILGARYDKNSHYGTSFNPRLGVVIRPNEKTNVKLLYGTAFLAPPPDKTYAHYGSFAPDPNNPGDVKSYYLHVPNPELKAEKVRSMQAEVSLKIDEKKRFTLNAYRSDISNLHQMAVLGPGTFKGKPVDTLAHWTNRGEATAYGGSIRFDGLSFHHNFRLKYFAALAFSNGDVAGEPLPYSSRTSAHAGLTFDRNRLTVSPRFIYQGKSYLQYKDASGMQLSNSPFVIANLFVRYRLNSGSKASHSIFINVRNLFDHRYYHPGFAEGGVGLSNAPQDPRYVSAGFDLQF